MNRPHSQQIIWKEKKVNKVTMDQPVLLGLTENPVPEDRQEMTVQGVTQGLKVRWNTIEQYWKWKENFRILTR